MGKILTLAIPTYNRAWALERLLSFLSEEIKGVEDEVEIFISDNASTDGTPEVIGKWEKKIGVRKRRNSQNYGYEVNAMRILAECSGEFFWGLGDDDLVKKGCVRKLVADLKELEVQHVSSIYVPSGGEDKKFKFSRIKVFSNTDKNYPPLLVGFGGSIMLRTAHALKIYQEKAWEEGKLICKKHEDKYFLDAFIHTYLFLECTKQTGKFAVCSYSGADFIGDGGEFTYEKMLWIYLVAIEENYDVKKYYPWFDADTAAYKWNTHFVSIFLVADRPGLEPVFDAYFAVLLKYMELDGEGGWAKIMRAVNFARKLPLARNFIVLTYDLFRAYKKARGKKDLFVRRADTSGHMRDKLDVAVRRAKFIVEGKPY
ncbi:MAG: glycosyltransferase family 2 protein [Candidatus Micrarchaeota archaeon]